jgi:hypothetical protein
LGEGSEVKTGLAVGIGKPEDIPPETVVHRIGGGSVGNLLPSPLDSQLTPPGISVLLGGSPQEAAGAMRRAFSKSRKWRESSKTVGTTTAEAIRRAGFDIVPDPTDRFPNHARLIHPDNAAGFTDDNLNVLAQGFQDTEGC